MMRRSTRTRHGHGSCDLSVVRRRRISIQHREEVTALSRVVARPHKQIGAVLGVSAHGPQQQNQTEEVAHKSTLCPPWHHLSTEGDDRAALALPTTLAIPSIHRALSAA